MQIMPNVKSSTTVSLRYTHPQYRYAPLQNKKSFRLLKLHPFNGEGQESHLRGHKSPFNGSLIETPLESGTQYECLSYTWGEPVFDHAILLDGCILQITENLDLGLRSVQKVARTSFLWIDAICINQEDLQERAQQVQLMKTIYSGAQQVLAFLGSEADESQDIPSICKRIINGAEKLEEVKPVKMDLDENIVFQEQAETLGLPFDDDPALVIFTKFLARPWFVRAWIIQEVVLARELKFICGDWSIIGELLFYTIQVATIHGLSLSISGVPGYAKARRGIAQIMMMCGMTISRLVPDDQSSKLSLLDIIEASSHQNATNPRDNVFALLGLSKEQVNPELQPDYTESVADTYRRFATYFINAGEGARLLEMIHSPTSDLDLPSWVPDWTARTADRLGVSPKNDLGNNNEDAFAKAGIGSTKFAAKVHGNRLTLKGYLIDKVERTGSSSIQSQGSLRNDPDQELGVQLLEGVVGFLAEIGEFLNVKSRYPTGEPKKEVLWRTVLCNRKMGTAKEAPESHRSFLESFMVLLKCACPPGWEGSLASSLPEDIFHLDMRQVICMMQKGLDEVFREASLFATMVAAQYQQRKPCVSNKGYVGQFPHTAKVGDMICIVAGAPVPFLIRPKGDEFTLVGECYLHGMMNGEVQSMAEYQIQDITLV